MSNNPQFPSANANYDPLPLTGEETPSRQLYDAPGSPLDQPFTPPPMDGQPRFMGQYDSAATRDSVSGHSYVQGQSDRGSVYPLNDAAAASSSRFDPYHDDPNGENIAMGGVASGAAIAREKEEIYGASTPRKNSRRKWFILGGIIGLILIILAVIIPVYFTVIKDKSDSDSDESNDSEGSKDDKTTTRPPRASASASDVEEENKIPVSGGDGSIITMEDGTTFVYRNPFGGTWYYDPNDPFNNGARPQSWSPALNETFRYGEHKMRGVNTGGWLVMEPFISPAPFEKYGYLNPPPIDEYELSQAMRADTGPGGGIQQIEEHYRTFITEKDFAEIAAAGLNYVRIPIGWWAIETRGDEPFLEGVSWQYFLKAVKWCRKYGLRINLDLHALPGSQNGWNHSGKFGTIGWLRGPMGMVNAQRSLDYIRVFAEFISQPQYKDVVTMFGIMNEALGEPVGRNQLERFYMEVYNIVRTAGGTGEGNGPWISYHDGFFSRSSWVNVLPNADRLSIDTHPYLCFGRQSNAPMSSYAQTPCNTWGSIVNTSNANFGLTNAGEWSNAVTDCGLFLNGVLLGTRYEGNYSGYPDSMGSCTEWTDWPNYTAEMKSAIMQFSMASMDALQNYFFWTWKIGDSLASGRVETPAWSYQLGLAQGWMPTDPRAADGICGNFAAWNPPLQPWQTGGVGAGDIPAAVTSALAWPPSYVNMGGALNEIPTLTPTGAIPTLTAPPITAGPGEPEITRTVDVGNGWNNPDDTRGFYVEVAGCPYLDPWVDPATPPPAPCGV